MPVLCDPVLSELSSVGATLGQSGTNTSQRTAEESTTPTEAVEVLGVSVEELEAARQLLVEEVNKPPRGKRYVCSAKEVLISAEV